MRCEKDADQTGAKAGTTRLTADARIAPGRAGAALPKAFALKVGYKQHGVLMTVAPINLDQISPRIQKPSGMRRFTMFRRGDLSATHDANQVNAPAEPQFEGVVFSDGSCSLRWLTAKRSTSVWSSFEDMLAIHGHPEYQSELVWHD